MRRQVRARMFVKTQTKLRHLARRVVHEQREMAISWRMHPTRRETGLTPTRLVGLSRIQLQICIDLFPQSAPRRNYTEPVRTRLLGGTP